MGIIQGELQLTGSYLSDLKATLQGVSGEDGTKSSAHVTEEHLEESLLRPEVIRCLRTHGIDHTEALGMLKLLGHESEDGIHQICVDEFIVGLLLLKDNTSKEMVTFWYENKQLLRKLFKFMEFTHQHFTYQEELLQRQRVFNKKMQSSIDSLHGKLPADS